MLWLKELHSPQQATYLLFVGVDQLFVIPVLQFARSLGSGHGRLEDKELAATFCSLEERKDLSKVCT